MNRFDRYLPYLCLLPLPIVVAMAVNVPDILDFRTETRLEIVNVDADNGSIFEDLRHQMINTRSLFVKDPMLGVRGRPLVSRGPHDVLGFRNYLVPNKCDIVTIGDSHTWGVGAGANNNWPAHLRADLARNDHETCVYNMSLGNWGPLQYYYISQIALKFRPKIIVVALQSGSDFTEAFGGADKYDHFSDFRIFGDEKVSLPPFSKRKRWKITITNKLRTVTNPQKRLYANQLGFKYVEYGRDITLLAIKKIEEKLAKSGVKLVVTVLPTKEYSFHKAVQAFLEQDTVPKEYSELIKMEKKNISYIEHGLENTDGVTYVSVHQLLSAAVKNKTVIYPRDANGHPNTKGYKVIGYEIGKVIRDKKLL